MKLDKFNEHDAVVGIEDIRHLIAIMFGNCDLLFIKKVLNKSGYPFGSPRSFASQLRDIHMQYLNNGNDIDNTRGYCGMTDPFDKLEKSLAI